ncbi:MAG: antibiotic acetyltransferase, partial [Flavobacteriaceae bacterium]|nr:antibiotic acetyltransferase [Flavobacteriaceae bacterium]
PYEIVGGIPAKHIKYRIKEDLIEKIRATKWWDKDENWLQENFHLFLNNDAFLKSFDKKP